MVKTAVNTPRNAHVPRQPTDSRTRANNGGSTNAAAPDPIVAKAIARPRFRKNHRGTTADRMRNPAPATEKPPTTPYSARNCQCDSTYATATSEIDASTPLATASVLAPCFRSANRPSTNMLPAPTSIRSVSPR